MRRDNSVDAAKQRSWVRGSPESMVAGATPGIGIDPGDERLRKFSQEGAGAAIAQMIRVVE